VRGIGTGQGSEYRKSLYPYAIRGRGLETDVEDGVTLTYTCRPPEQDFPVYFETALATALAAEICVPITEDSKRAESLMAEAARLFTEARLVDSQQDTPEEIYSGSLIDCRVG
jgi:hypothetical protein